MEELESVITADMKPSFYTGMNTIKRNVHGGLTTTITTTTTTTAVVVVVVAKFVLHIMKL